MKRTTQKVTAALLATGLFACSGAALATNGYFTHGVGTESKGMAGTGVASRNRRHLHQVPQQGSVEWRQRQAERVEPAAGLG